MIEVKRELECYRTRTLGRGGSILTRTVPVVTM